MNHPLEITVLIPTRNEAANLATCLASLVPVARVLVVDSNSRDDTCAIARAAGAEVVPFRWNGRYPRKRQWALDTRTITTPWVMLLDADEIVPPQLWEEVRTAVFSKQPAEAYLATKGFHFQGRRFRFGGFNHASVFLFQTGSARFENLLPDVGEDLDMEVHERLQVDGTLGAFRTPIAHRDQKDLQAYLHRHRAYATWEAELRWRFLQTGRYGEDAIQPRWNGNLQQRRRFLKLIAMRLPCEPELWFLYHALLRGGLFEGRPGIEAARIRRRYIREVRARLRERRRHPAETLRKIPS